MSRDFIILGVFNIDTYFWCGRYYFNIDGDYIIPYNSNKKLYSLSEFETYVKCLNIFEDDAKVEFYDEELDDWLSTINL